MADGNWEWVTPGECADWWNELFQKKANDIAEKASGVPYVGFYVSWNVYSLADAVNLLFLDNMRLGQGAADAVDNPDGKGLIGRGLSVLADLGRASFFLPVGRVMKGVLGPLERAGGRTGAVVLEDAARVPGPHAPAPTTPPMRSAPVGDAIARGNPAPEVNSFFRNLFYFHDPAKNLGICWFTSLGQALRYTGRYWISLDKLLELFPSLKKFATLEEKLAHLDTMAHFDFGNIAIYLNKLRVSFKPLEKVKSITELYQAAGNKLNGAIMFGIRWVHPTQGEAGHALYLAMRSNGKLAIFDRTGLVVDSFAEFERLALEHGLEQYRGIGKAVLLERCQPLLIYNARIIEHTWRAFKIGMGSGLFGALAIEVKVISAMFDRK